MRKIYGQKKRRVSSDRLVFNILSFTVLTVLSLICLLPFWLVVSG